jgi:hypothetical protein
MRIVRCALAAPGIGDWDGADMTDSIHDGPARPGIGTLRHQPGAGSDGLLAVARNLSQYHREHEKYYSEAPLTEAISLQRTRTDASCACGTMDRRRARRRTCSQPLRRHT